ncbi:MAG: threonine synthase [Bacteroidota bacterium]
MAEIFHFVCNDCGITISSSAVIYLCPDCEKKNSKDQPPYGVLKTVYDYGDIKKKYSSDIFSPLEKNSFLELLPIKSLASLPYLKVGNTPLYKIENFDENQRDVYLFLKDDSQNPTFSFKDRASAIVSAYAKENNLSTIATASTGNAGSSLAGICASQKQKAVIFVPAAAPVAKLTQIIMYGATIVPVDGNYDTAFDLSIEATKKFGWYNRNTAYNPFTIEGKKTVSYEIFSQLSQQIPDRIFVPVGDGVIISGVYKGFEDLLNLGIIDKIPTIVAVQAIGSSNIIENIDRDKFISVPSKTLADSISVDIPRNFRMAKSYIKKYAGETIQVSDEEIIAASMLLSSRTGIFSEPAAAAAFAGFLAYLWDGRFEKGSRNVVLLTGSGLKDLKAVQGAINIPAAVKPDIREVEKYLKNNTLFKL